MLDDADLARALAVAEEAAGVGAGIVARRQDERTTGSELKGAGDYVTAVDRMSEEAIRRFWRGPHRRSRWSARPTPASP